MSDASETPWRQREHDHLVEPMFGGIHGAHDRSRTGEFVAGASRELWIWVALAAVAATLLVPL